MTTKNYWGKNTLARWFSCCALLAFSAAAAELPVTRLGQGINNYKAKDYAGAAQQLAGVAASLPKVADYAAYHLASAQMQTGDLDGALKTFAAYAAKPVASSPMNGRIWLWQARALLDQRVGISNKRALDLLQSQYKTLPQPDGDFAMGLAYEALDEKPQAALSYSKVYHSYPNTELAAQASTALERLRAAMGKAFPSPPPSQQLERPQKWIDAREYFKARQEYAALSSSLGGTDRDLAQVGIGAADYYGGDHDAAFRYLKGLGTPRGEAEARRLYYLTEAARKVGDDGAMADALKEMEKLYAKSTWRLKALISAGNRYLVTNDRDKYEPLYRAASDSFPADNAAAYAHWKVTWNAYLADRADRAELLREQIARYPADSYAATALFFLGRYHEKAGKFAEARAGYEKLAAQFPHYYYGVMARERMKDAKVLAAKPDPAVSEWLSAVAWPTHRDFSDVDANEKTRARIDRARLLMMAGLPDMADAELRFGSKLEEEQPHLLAMELARSMPSPFYSLRIMKSFSTDYLSLPTHAAPMQFWHLLFPFPYKDDVVRNAESRGLDPYLVAALIRQETEFNPSAHSHANAYGLMQLVPATGRMVGRQLGVSVNTRNLLEPALNVRLGTQYLKSQLDQWGGDWTQTLAAYNAGPGRVKEWLTWNRYREPAEFVESIPFTETREYVQAVLRNADMYRVVYGEKRAAGPDVKDTSEVPAVRLSSLPLAARTPGGGRKTVVARRAAKKKAVRKGRAVTARKAPARRNAPAKRKR